VARDRLIEPFVAAGMPDESAGDQLLEFARAVPRALVVGIEDVTCGVEADTARGTHAGTGRQHLPLRRDAQAPAAIRIVAGERTGQAQHNPHISFAVELRAEGV